MNNLAGEQPRSDNMHDVLYAAAELGTWTTTELVDHLAVDIGQWQVLDCLEILRKRDVLSHWQDPVNGRRIQWTNTGVRLVNEHGDVELDALSVDELTNEEVAELARTTTYM